MKLADLNYTAAEIKAFAKKYMIETYERFDFIAETAEGMYLYDEQGKGYLDFYGGVAVNNVGNRNPKVVEAIKNQADCILHTFNYPYTIPQAILAKLICETIGMDKIFFQNSGTEANEAMIKLARKYGVEHFGPNKYRIITAKKSFHGRTFGSLSATGQPDTKNQLGYLPGVPGFAYVPFNDLEAIKTSYTEDTIAIMLEPIQGEGGVNVADKSYLQGVRQFCDEKNILLLLDEVQTGWGRAGENMAFQYYDIKPDIVSMAKGMGGGVPIGAICATAKVATAFDSGAHGSTYGGSPLCCAASYAAISELIDLNLAQNAAEVGQYLQKQLRNLPKIKEVRGLGLLIAVEFNQPIAHEVKIALFNNQMLVTMLNESTIRLTPPLIATTDDCNLAVEKLKKVIKEK
ncbi:MULTISPECIES: acetylornithine/succinylornithine family transaminase [unclassified Enterococcus]|uniref:aspartate aminotransferase family protein n=1 Tax=unclassified Enterococcus TaxID=2608891 RepID=UPI001554D9AD|nr:MULTISPECIES: acetylornithine/succinylornithine family transaminase [unclassified Enterococcus]MBS7578259.1 acetylornithine/succinylornithine family transaminase [Enterococcus sp. MMGLQ5-2]MBS7585439.1 acetylornithine/succinylornithine family transaminase [Enterococcus sp. MMGLQ5-1]NPD13296.1 acetylornithine/succinylornithine family transaminase [Enterococcus sp. MMGLQ5-1]NPD38090.1 acetylornithine/succinylornithine family transaminase [Enterococcus sp. MMGLQ5-2]